MPFSVKQSECVDIVCESRTLPETMANIKGLYSHCSLADQQLNLFTLAFNLLLEMLMKSKIPLPSRSIILCRRSYGAPAAIRFCFLKEEQLHMDVGVVVIGHEPHPQISNLKICLFKKLCEISL